MSEFPQLAADPGRGRKLLLLLLLLLLATVSASSASMPPGPAPSTSAPPLPALASVGYAEPLSLPLTAVAQDAGRVPALRMPVVGPVVRGFEARAGPFGPGHRGIDIASPRGERVRTPAAGRIAFAGRVAGTTWVSLVVAPEVVVTVGPLLDLAVSRGQQVPVRTPVGRLGPGHGAATLAGWANSDERAALHLSVRVDGVYVDPLAYLVDRPRPRLAPLAAPGGLPPP